MLRRFSFTLPTLNKRSNAIPRPNHITVVRVSHEEFYKMSNDNSESVKNARFIPPAIGSGSLGEFEVQLDPSKELVNEF
jgi:hypothetical protein